MMQLTGAAEIYKIPAMTKSDWTYEETTAGRPASAQQSRPISQSCAADAAAGQSINGNGTGFTDDKLKSTWLWRTGPRSRATE